LISAVKVEKEHNKIKIVGADQEVRKQKVKNYKLKKEEYLKECSAKYQRKK